MKKLKQNKNKNDCFNKLHRFLSLLALDFSTMALDMDIGSIVILARSSLDQHSLLPSQLQYMDKNILNNSRTCCHNNRINHFENHFLFIVLNQVIKRVTIMKFKSLKLTPLFFYFVFVFINLFLF
jgi:hypothetical protein